MNSKQKKILAAVFKNLVSGAIAWDDIENLLLSVGCICVEGSGSRVRFVKGDEIEAFDRPHPAKGAKRYQVIAARQFLFDWEKHHEHDELQGLYGPRRV